MRFETPFFTEPIPIEFYKEEIPDRFKNFTNFTIYLFENNFSPLLDEIGSYLDFHMKYDPYDENCTNRYRYFVELVDEEDNPITYLDEVTKERVREAIEMAAREKLCYVFPFNIELFTYGNIRIPPAWINAMILYAPYNFLQPQLKDNGIYISLMENTDYTRILRDFQENVIDWLRKQYEKGVLPYIFTKKFIEEWDLVEERMFYRPNYIYPTIMGNDAVEFFTQRVSPHSDGKRYIWSTLPFKEPYELELVSQNLNKMGVKYAIDQYRFHIVVTGMNDVIFINKSMRKSLLLTENTVKMIENYHWFLEDKEDNELVKETFLLREENPFSPAKLLLR